MRIFICGTGIISPAGSGTEILPDFLRKGTCAIGPLRLFPLSPENRLPVGEISAEDTVDSGLETEIPRTHRLAETAARQAVKNASGPPDAVVLGVTTGGMLRTEELLKQGISDPDTFCCHGTGTVARYLADLLGCKGPVLTVSTACSSGAAAIKIALEMLRSGQARRVLAGGADSLCRLTYYGFKSLQLIDPRGARPLDRSRRGMSVGEAAAMLLLEAGENIPGNALGEIMGGGLSCDAYHPSSPHPEGKGAQRAMENALRDAGISPSGIDYINLHGTGTPDNDLAEARAIVRVFGKHPPPFSSLKGAMGHSLAASGAVEAIASLICIRESFIPANTGCGDADPALEIRPLLHSVPADIRVVLSNSFGFGGNNAALVIGNPQKCGPETVSGKKKSSPPLRIKGYSCISGAGTGEETYGQIFTGKECRGTLPLAEISRNLPPGTVRRMKRLPRMALSLAVSAWKNSGLPLQPDSIFMGTGWGPLSETHDFLTQLFETDEKFCSPTDFIASVHNAPAGHIAIYFGAEGANITLTGGDYSFEQALLSAHLTAEEGEKPFLLIAADEHHEKLSPLFDRSCISDTVPSDGGGAFCLQRSGQDAGISIFPLFFQNAADNPEIISSLSSTLKNSGSEFAAVMAGIPAAFRQKGEKQLGDFLKEWPLPFADYRKFTGEFASASAVAAVLAADFMQKGRIPPAFIKGLPELPGDKGILLLGLGQFITAVGILP